MLWNRLALLVVAAALIVGCSGAAVGPEQATLGLPLYPDAREDDRTRDERIRDGRTLRRDTPSTIGRPAPGIVLPYTVEHVISTFGDCRSGGRTHAGIDLAGVGEYSGLGTPIYAMARAEITMIGLPEDDPDQFGRPDRRGGTTERGGLDLPRVLEVAGYGEVHFFTRNYGSWHSGAVLVTEVIDGPLAGHQVRYMHLGTVHPELREGDVVEAGQEIGLMGGTAIMHDIPHVHIDIEDVSGDRVDPAPLLGLERDDRRCRR